jgi:hypothetical protein
VLHVNLRGEVKQDRHAVSFPNNLTTYQVGAAVCFREAMFQGGKLDKGKRSPAFSVEKPAICASPLRTTQAACPWNFPEWQAAFSLP